MREETVTYTTSLHLLVSTKDVSLKDPFVGGPHLIL